MPHSNAVINEKHCSWFLDWTQSTIWYSCTMRDSTIKSRRVLQIQTSFCVSVMRPIWDHVCALQRHDATPYQSFWGIRYLHIQGRKNFLLSSRKRQLIPQKRWFTVFTMSQRENRNRDIQPRGPQNSQDSYTLLNVVAYWLSSGFAAGPWFKSRSGNLPSRFSSVRPTRNAMLTTHVQSGPTRGALPPLSV
jgi:hypothetical protein